MGGPTPVPAGASGGELTDKSPRPQSDRCDSGGAASPSTFLLSAVPLPFPGEIAGDSPTMATGVHAAGPSPAPAEAPCSPVSPLEAAGTDYERVRAARIRENMERMQKLGILDLAHTLTSSSLAAAAAGSGSGGGAGRGRPRRKPVEPGSDGAPPPKARPAPRAPARRSLRYGPELEA